MGIKLTGKKETEAVTEAVTNPDFIDDGITDVTETPATPVKAAKVKKEKKVKAEKAPKAEKIKPTVGVFLIKSPDGAFKFVGTSSRIEVCLKDYFSWLAKGIHGNKAMQAAYDANKGNLQTEVLAVCERTDLQNAKKKACKENGIDMKMPFSDEVIKAADIVVE